MSKVYIDKADVEYGEKSYEAAKKILTKANFKVKNKKVLIKPNLVTDDISISGITADVSICKAILDKLENCEVTIGNDFDNFEATGYNKLKKEYNLKIIAFDKLNEKDIIFKPVKTPFKFDKIPLARQVLEADYIVSLAKLKIHALCQVTLSLKNMFGCVVGARKPQWHMAAGDSEAFARMLIDTYLFLKPRLTIIDGIVGMEGNGPGSGGEPRKLGLIFASTDCIALDRVITEVLGAKAHDLLTTKVAEEDGLGETDIDNINILGERIEDVKVSHFKFPPVVSIEFKLPFSLHSYLRKPLTSRPYINKKECTLCNICVEICPPGIMTKTDRININYDDCIRCYCCLEMCPEGAITIKNGWLKRLIAR